MSNGAPVPNADAPQHARGTEEFSRVLNFSDAIFAIAMTLLVISVEVPGLADADSTRDLANALNDEGADIVSFFISFAVIGRFWFAHHQFFALLKGADRGLIGINLFYLAFIAFLPFPTALIGDYFDNPLAVATYAVAVGVVSGLEVVLFRHAFRNHLMKRTMPVDIYRWGVLASLSPVAIFLASVPVAYVSTTAALLLWAATIPLGSLINRHKPEGTDDFLTS